MSGSPLFDPRWSVVFDEWDRLLVDSSIRLAERDGDGLEVTEPLFLGLLLVAKALRHSHAAIALDRDGFSRLFEELFAAAIVAAGDDGTLSTVDPDDLRHALGSADARLVGTVDLSDPVLSSIGSPFVLSLDDGSPAYVSTRRLAFAECAIATRLLDAAVHEERLSGTALPLPATSEVIDAADPSFLNDGVRSFIEGALTRKISVLTGGPGSGKTTAIATLLRALGEIALRDGRRFNIALCAPTAKAAVRMREALDVAFGEEGLATYEDELVINPRSGSVHRLLEIRPDASTTTVELACDLVIVDEVSMLELTLLDQVLRAAGTSHVVLVGDPDQLVSVEVGAVLRDIVEAGNLPGEPLDHLVTTLSASHRSNDAIVELSEAINSGDHDAFLAAVRRHPTELNVVATPAGLLPELVDRAETLRGFAGAGDADAALRELASQVVLCANREGTRSVTWWNKRIVDALERRAPAGGDASRFPIGTPVMLLRNEPTSAHELSARLSNGDVGVVCAADGGPEVVFLPPNDVPRRRKVCMIDQASAAWAFTIHKSQGSEYDRVIVSLPETPNRILSRELLYTAVTRAKSGVVVVGTSDVIAAALSRRVERVSGLTRRLRSRA